MKNFIGENIENIATLEEIKEGIENKYGTIDISIYRNIFGINNDMWCQGLSRSVLEINKLNKIVNQIDQF